MQSKQSSDVKTISQEKQWPKIIALVGFIISCVIVILLYIIPVALAILCFLLAFLRFSLETVDSLVIFTVKYCVVLIWLTLIVGALISISNLTALFGLNNLKDPKVKIKTIIWIGSSSAIILLFALKYILPYSLTWLDMLNFAIIAIAIVLNSKAGGNTQIWKMSKEKIKTVSTVLRITTILEVILLVFVAISLLKYMPIYEGIMRENFDTNTSIDSFETLSI